MEGYFLGESLDVEEQFTSVSDVTILVIGVVSVSGSYRDGEFLSREIVLLNKCQSMQEMSAPLSTSARVVMTFMECEGIIS